MLTDLMVVVVCLKVIRDFDSSSLHVGIPNSISLLTACEENDAQPERRATQCLAWLISPQPSRIRTWPESLASNTCVHTSCHDSRLRQCLAYIADSASPLVDTSAATGCESDQNDVAEHERRAQPVVVFFTFVCWIGYDFCLFLEIFCLTFNQWFSDFFGVCVADFLLNFV